MTSLPTGCCRLYAADVTPLCDAAVFRALYETVPDERRRAVDRLRPDADKRRSLGAGVLLNKALSDAGLDPACLTIARTEAGKPYLPDCPGVHISLSHAGDVVLCAVAGAPVGCDAEIIDPRRVRVAARCFTPEENALIDAAVTSHDRAVLFTRLWVLKESFLKVTGRGLSLPMSSFRFVLLPGCRPVLVQTYDAFDYVCHEFAPADLGGCGYRYACVVRAGDGAPEPPVCRTVPLVSS